jgi:crotonobetainyl-CoA:carnitine CoA-transferase CaiB-like acyl-CoA transferase
MRGWGLDYPNLKKIKPDIILVSNTGYGHGGGPYSSYPAQATTQEGTHGHCWITGQPDGPPAKAGASFVDFLSTWSAIFAIGAALRYRNQTGKGQWVDIGMYQAGVMFLSEYIMDAVANGREGQRIGNRHPYRAPQGCYRTNGPDHWITLSVGSDEEWQALGRLLGRVELGQDPKFATVLARQQNHDEIDEIIRAWTIQHDRYDLMHQLQGVGIPAGPVLSGKDIHFDPQYQSRNFLERVEFPPERGLGTRLFMGRPYKFSNSPLKITGPAPEFGEANGELLKDLLGMDEATYENLVQEAVISTRPLSGEASPQNTPQRALELGLMADWDPDYREHLGIS